MSKITLNAEAASAGLANLERERSKPIDIHPSVFQQSNRDRFKHLANNLGCLLFGYFCRACNRGCEIGFGHFIHHSGCFERNSRTRMIASSVASSRR